MKSASILRFRIPALASAAAAVSLLSPLAVFATPAYTISALATPFGATYVEAVGLNDVGQIIGNYDDADGVTHAVVWSGNSYTQLPDLVGGVSNVNAINNAGTIVGRANSAAGYYHATSWNYSRDTGAYSVTDIGIIGGAGASSAIDINDAGTIVGTSKAARGNHAFTWTPSAGFVDYGSNNSNVNAETAGFNAINNNGLMGGTYYYYGSPFKPQIAHEGDKGITPITAFPTMQYTQGMVLDINDAGTLVGYQNSGRGPVHAAILNPDSPENYIDLGDLGMGGESFAYGINEDGIIVGSAWDPTGEGLNKAFVYADKTMYDLGTLISNFEGWDGIVAANGINEQGQIVGLGLYNGQVTAFILTPTAIPEPAALGVPLVIGGSLLRRRR